MDGEVAGYCADDEGGGDHGDDEGLADGADEVVFVEGVSLGVCFEEQRGGWVFLWVSRGVTAICHYVFGDYVEAVAGFFDGFPVARSPGLDEGVDVFF